MNFIATKARVLNRGVPPNSFLSELVTWGKTAPDAIFAPNLAPDIYSSVKAQLGPWNGPLHRKAVMLEVLRVLAGFESSWHWTEGVDTTNPHSLTHVEGQEAGIFQVSADSMAFGDLRAFAALHGVHSSLDFIATTKSNHAFALEYCARLLRVSIAWDGPIKRREIHPWLSRAAVAEFDRLLS